MRWWIPVIAVGPIFGGTVLILWLLFALLVWSVVFHILLLVFGLVFGGWLMWSALRMPQTPPDEPERRVWRYGR